MGAVLGIRAICRALVFWRVSRIFVSTAFPFFCLGECPVTFPFIRCLFDRGGF